MKFIEPRPLADPDTAARKLMEIASAVEPVQDGRIYIELINAPFLYQLKGTPAEYKAGLEHAIAKGPARERHLCPLHRGRRGAVRVRWEVATRSGVLIAAMLAASSVSADEPPLTIGQLLGQGWEIAGYASGYDNRTSLILFRQPGINALVQCSALYDVTRSPRTVVNCYELR
jgi:hypothetical protein